MKNQVTVFAIIGLTILSGLLGWHSEHIKRERDKAVKERDDAAMRVSELTTRESELQTSLSLRENQLRAFQTQFEKTQEAIHNATPNECTDVAVAPDIDRGLREQTGASDSMQLPGAAGSRTQGARNSEVGRRHEPRLGIARFESRKSCTRVRS